MRSDLPSTTQTAVQFPAVALASACPDLVGSHASAIAAHAALCARRTRWLSFLAMALVLRSWTRHCGCSPLLARQRELSLSSPGHLWVALQSTPLETHCLRRHLTSARPVTLCCWLPLAGELTDSTSATSFCCRRAGSDLASAAAAGVHWLRQLASRLKAAGVYAWCDISSDASSERWVITRHTCYNQFAPSGACKHTQLSSLSQG